MYTNYPTNVQPTFSPYYPVTPISPLGQQLINPAGIYPTPYVNPLLANIQTPYVNPLVNPAIPSPYTAAPIAYQPQVPVVQAIQTPYQPVAPIAQTTPLQYQPGYVPANPAVALTQEIPFPYLRYSQNTQPISTTATYQQSPIATTTGVH